MKADTDFPEATPCEISTPEEKKVLCKFFSEQSGSQIFYFCIRITELEKGETGTIDIAWPRRWTAADLPADANDETIRRMTGHDSFVVVLPEIVMQSTDLNEWHPVNRATVDEENEMLSVEVVGKGHPIYVCTQIPFRTCYYEALLDEVRSVAPEVLSEIGCSQSGMPLHVIALDATQCNPLDAPTVYVQALQHHSEHTGAFVVDTLVRYLLNDSVGRTLREKVNWEIMPAFDPDGLYGRGDVAKQNTGKDIRSKNPNRDWDVAEWPEVAAVKAWWKQRMEAGRTYALCFDLHNGWSNRRSTGAAYTIDIESDDNAEYIGVQKKFIDWMTSRTNHEVASYWRHQLPFGLCCKGCFHEMTQGMGFTVEFSRFKWWNLEKQAYEPTRPEHPSRFAHEAAQAVVDWFKNG